MKSLASRAAVNGLSRGLQKLVRVLRDRHPKIDDSSENVQ
jgi:hypothetical protein